MNNNIYLYDGTFTCLLDLINKLITLNIKPLNICDKNNFRPSLLDEVIELDLNNNFDLKILNISQKIIKAIYYVYLSTNTSKELIIYYFLLNALKYQEKIFYMRNLKCVVSTLKIVKYVSNENHKLKGFLRFKELNNKILYSEISPTNNILELLSYHFANRLKNEYWVIKDVGRNMYSIYNKNKYYIINGESITLNEIQSHSEKEVENLWISFFNTIPIKERLNKRCQMNFMPKKYWKYIIEMEGVYEESHHG